LLLGCCLIRPAWANVYEFVDENGTMHFTNVPTDARYRIMLRGPSEDPAEKAAVATVKAGRSPATKVKYDGIVDQVARTYGLDSALLHAVISVESHYNPAATSKKGAAGLMQLMPGTAKRYGVADSYDPVQNLHGGAKYLRDLLKMFGSDVNLALAAYNAGENAVVRYGNRIPPFRETMDYIPRVLNFYRKYQASL